MFATFLKAAAVGALLVSGLAGPAMAQKTTLTIYTALENDQLADFKKAIEEAVPQVEVAWVRDSTGVITARFLAEKDNPKADMVLGQAATALLVFEKMGLLETYKPNGVDSLKQAFRDAKEPYTWTGMDAYLGVICFNTAEAGKINVKTPTSWKDMLNPALKGQLVMPHPASSGTGYLMVGAWLQTMGEAEGWKFMDALHENIAVYTHSGSAPCVQAAKGERVAGIALDMRGASEKTKGAPLEVVIPTDPLPPTPLTGRSRPKARAGRWRRAPSSRERRISSWPRRWPIGSRPRVPTRSTPRPTQSWRCRTPASTRRTIPPTPRS